MRIGIFIGPVRVATDTDLEGLVQQVVDAEQDGFDSFWSAQTLGIDALTLLAQAGQRTSTIELGTAVVPIYMRHPLAMAMQALTTQAACGGRLSLGIGPGHRRTVEGDLGLSFEKPASRMREYLSVTRKLVEDGSVDHSGQFYRIDLSLQRPEGQAPTILISALGSRMLGIAGELADGTITWMVGPKTLGGHIAPGITAAAEAAGRPTPRICVGVPIAVTDDLAAARSEAFTLFNRYAENPPYRRMLDVEGAEGPADVVVVGDEAQVEEQLRRLAEAGATDLLATVFPVGPDAQASVARTQELLRSLVGKITG
jgi:F420-dependent oxidoreductase-like protein